VRVFSFRNKKKNPKNFNLLIFKILLIFELCIFLFLDFCKNINKVVHQKPAVKSFLAKKNLWMDKIPRPRLEYLFK
jgi:hypothetical protein